MSLQLASSLATVCTTALITRIPHAICRFKGLSFDAALRLILESFRLPGEAQKIDRIVNCFGRYYYRPTRRCWRTLTQPTCSHTPLYAQHGQAQHAGARGDCQCCCGGVAGSATNSNTTPPLCTTLNMLAGSALLHAPASNEPDAAGPMQALPCTHSC
jgi:hypothetical protein